MPHSRRHLGSVVAAGLCGAALVRAPSRAQAQPGRLRLVERARIPLGSSVTALAWAPDGRRIAAVANWGSEVVVIDTANWREVTRFQRTQELSPLSLGFAAGGREIVTMASDRRDRSPWAFGVYETDTGRLLRHAPQPEEPKIVRAPRNIVVSPDGQYAVLAAAPRGLPDQCLLYDVQRAAFLGAIQPDRPASFYPMSISRDSRLAAAVVYHGEDAGPHVRKTIQVFDLPSLERRLVIPAHVPRVRSIGWSPEGTRLASGAHGMSEAPDPSTGALRLWRDEDPIRIWNAATGQLERSFVQRTEPIAWIAWHPEGRLIITISAKGTEEIGTMVHILSLDAAEPLFAFRNPGRELINIPSFDPTGRLIAWSEDRGVRIMALAGA